MTDHPFTEYLRILGKGPKSKRPLTQDEALTAIEMILAGEVTEKQLGAFLLLMRANGETADELIGFIKGIRRFYQLNDSHDSASKNSIDLDISAYAGKWRYPPYFLLSIKLLVQNGYKVLLHGDSGQFNNRQYADAFLHELGFYQATSINDARAYIVGGKAVYLPLIEFAPDLKNILHLKSELGVRTVFNTAVKVLNPLNAPATMQGIFHKGVENLHHAAAQANQTKTNLVFKGEGGEPEIRPDAFTRLFFSQHKQAELRELKIYSTCERAIRPQNWTINDIVDLWDNKLDAAETAHKLYAENAVISTAAVALMAIEQLGFNDALEKAKVFWNER